MRSNLSLELACLAIGASLVASCSGDITRECGFGTEERDGKCVTVTTCGPGTNLADGECVAEGTGNGALQCAQGTVPNSAGTACIVAPEACAPPTQLDTLTGRCVSPGTIVCGEGTEREGNVCVPACPGPFEVQNAQRTGCRAAYRIQILNASPGDAVTAIDIYTGSRLVTDDDDRIVGEGVAYGEATPFFKQAVTEPLTITPAREPGNALNDASFTEDFMAGETLFMAIVGVGPAGIYNRAAGELDFSFPSLSNYEESADHEDARLIVLHASTDLGPVGFGRQDSYGVAPAVPYDDSIVYATGSPFFEVPRASLPSDLYLRDITPTPPLLSAQFSARAFGPSSEPFPPGSVATLAFIGFVDPSLNTGNDGVPGPALEVIAVLPDGTVYPLDPAARIQVVNTTDSTLDVNLADPVATSLTGEPIADTLAPGFATGLRSFTGGLDYRALLSTDGTTVSDAFDLVLGPGSVERWVIAGSGSNVLIRANALEEGTIPGNLAGQVVHATSGLGEVDVHVTRLDNVDLSSPEAASLVFGEAGQDSFSRAFETVRVTVTEPGTQTILHDFDVDLASLGFAAGESILFVLAGASDAPGLVLVDDAGSVQTVDPN